jgi:predicted outer membrane repeat protein
MLHKAPGKVAVVVGVLAAASLGPAQAAQAAANVPCSTASLSIAIGSAARGQTLNLAPHCEYVLTEALPTVHQDLTIMGDHATLRGNAPRAAAPFPLLSVVAGTLNVTDLNFANGAGGILAADNSILNVQGGTFTANHAVDGGAISLTGNAVGYVTGATFDRNTASQYGGAVSAGYPATFAVLTDDKVTANTAGQDGGAFIDIGISSTLTNVTMTGNSAADGGAIYVASDSKNFLTNVKMLRNSATDNGGALYTFINTDVANSIIADNHAAMGGGIYNDDAWDTFTGSTIAGNRATSDGGGIYNIFTGLQGDVTLTNSPVTDNTSGADGGGIYNDTAVVPAPGMASVQAEGSPIDGNRAAGPGGGVYNNQGLVQLTASPVQHNRPDNCAPPGSVALCTNGSRPAHHQ